MVEAEAARGPRGKGFKLRTRIEFMLPLISILNSRNRLDSSCKYNDFCIRSIEVDFVGVKANMYSNKKDCESLLS